MSTEDACRRAGRHDVSCEWPAQQRIVTVGQPQHEELSGHDSPGDLRAAKPEAVRILRDRHVLPRPRPVRARRYRRKWEKTWV